MGLVLHITLIQGTGVEQFFKFSVLKRREKISRESWPGPHAEVIHTPGFDWHSLSSSYVDA